MTLPSSPAYVFGGGRLGSTLTPLSRADSIALVRRAYELGVRHFDTASIYGQGDSERLLGAALRDVRADVVIATKAGQRLTPKQRLLRPFKPLIRWLIGRRRGAAPAAAPPAVAAVVAAQRAQGVRYCFEPAYLVRSLRGSLSRLGSDRVDVFYLHSPPPEVLRDPALHPALARAKADGLVRQLGVSCDDLDTAEAALAWPGTEVLQFEPDAGARSQAVLDEAARRGILVVGRVGPARAGGAVAAIARLLEAPAMHGVIMGTTRAAHLAENVQAFEQARRLRASRPA